MNNEQWMDSPSTTNRYIKSYFNGFVDISGGNLYLRGNEATGMNYSLYINNGDISLNGRLFVSRDVSMNQRLFIGGDTSLNGKLFVNGDASMNNRLFLGGDSTMNQRFYVLGDTKISKYLVKLKISNLSKSPTIV